MGNISKQIKSLDISKIKMKNGRSVVDELKRHAVILANCIMYELDLVYASYTPKVWKRDYSLYNSIYIDDFVEIRSTVNGQQASIRLRFDEGAFHRNFDGEMVNTALLINDGYKTHGSFADVDYLGWRSPTFYIEKGIERYKNKVQRPFGVIIAKN